MNAERSLVRWHRRILASSPLATAATPPASCTRRSLGRKLVRAVRPRGVSGLFLARAPLTLQLRLAAQQGRPMSNADQSEFSPDKITNDSSQMMGYAAGVCLASARACAAF
jgi:hypothetical protein